MSFDRDRVAHGLEFRPDPKSDIFARNRAGEENKHLACEMWKLYDYTLAAVNESRYPEEILRADAA